ncbi:MAG: hypothetical protein ACXWW1_08610 [Aeromicrobium sp.]
MTGVSVVRVVLGVIGALLIVGGLALAWAFAGSGGVFGGFWMIVSGVVLLIAVVIETTRYRSQHAERQQLPPGPGGGETSPLEPRFRPTEEVFVDPTSHLRMRVYMDARSGERRYIAEG